MGRGSGGWLRPQCTTYSQPVDVLRRLGCNRRVVQTATHCSMHERVSIAPCSWQKHLRRRLQIASAQQRAVGTAAQMHVLLILD